MSENELNGLRNIIKADMLAEYERYKRDVNRHFWAGGPPPKLTRIQRARNRLRWRIRGARTSLAQRIAPWLDEGYY
jgi:hypothetical protein